MILLRFWSKGAFFQLSRDTFFGIQKRRLFSTPKGGQKRGFCLGVVAKLTILAQLFPLRKFVIFVFFLTSLGGAKSDFRTIVLAKIMSSVGGEIWPQQGSLGYAGGGQQALRSRGVAQIAVSLGGTPPLSTQAPGPRKGGKGGFFIQITKSKRHDPKGRRIP